MARSTGAFASCRYKEKTKKRSSISQIRDTFRAHMPPSSSYEDAVHLWFVSYLMCMDQADIFAQPIRKGIIE